MIAPKAKNEKKRLEVLWQYEVLDTVPEAAFDDLTELAASICNAPIAMITLVDEKRQWFKSRIGVSLEETSREVSFCSHAILQEDLFIIPDALRDKRFARNPLVAAGPGIRFYAGAPLITPDGHALGTLCVIDKVPHVLRPEQKRALTILSRHVMTQLELRHRSKQLACVSEEKVKLQSELRQVRAELAQARRASAGVNGKKRLVRQKLATSGRRRRF